MKQYLGITQYSERKRCYPYNTIHGVKPEFGNPVHIQFVRDWQMVLCGKNKVADFEWRYFDSMKGFEMNFDDDLSSCDTIFFEFNCPFCCYSNQYNFYYKHDITNSDSFVEAEKEIENGFHFEKCDESFIAGLYEGIYYLPTKPETLW